MKRGPYRKKLKSPIPKSCLNCAGPIQNKLLLFPSTRDRVKFCQFECKSEYQKGKTPSDGTRYKMSVAHMGNKSNTGRVFTDEHLKNMSLAFKGEKHWNWQGGITKESHLRRNQLEYKQWRTSVFQRDGYKCKMTGADCVHEVHAHHILRFSEYPELRYDVNNGITLCENHHPMGKMKEKEMEPLYKSLITNGN